MSVAEPSSRDDFEIAIICALPIEYDAVVLVFDQFWDEAGDRFDRAAGDNNHYTTGRIGKYNVVLALCHMGKVHAAGAAASLRSSYRALKLTLLVGICGGVPFADGREILLGDVIMSSAVVQYDFGRKYPDRLARKDTVDDNLGRPNRDIRNLVAMLGTDLGSNRLKQRTATILRDLQAKAGQKEWLARDKYKYPGAAQDTLFKTSYRHKHRTAGTCICGGCVDDADPVCEEALCASCVDLGCEAGQLVPRDRLERKRQMEQAGDIATQDPSLWVGTVASGDWVIKSAQDRDTIAQHTGAIGLEMEGAGVWDEVPCIVVKGVCDYADCHKSKNWQNFAAATAASTAKSILERYTATSRAQRQLDIELRIDNSRYYRIPPFVSNITDQPAQGDDPLGAFFLPLNASEIAEVPHFVARTEELERLHQTLGKIDGRRTAVLQGLGGMGKTQLAIAYLKRHRPDYSATIWLNARDVSSLQQSFARTATWILDRHSKLLSLKAAVESQDFDAIVEAVKWWLNEPRNNRWLLVYDNYDEPQLKRGKDGNGKSMHALDTQLEGAFSRSDKEISKAFDIRPFLPESDHGAVLITTRSSAVTIGEKVRLGKLRDVKDSLEILASTSNRQDVDKDEAAFQVAMRLDGLPLALSTAGAYMDQVSTSWTEYLELYQKSWLRLQEASPELSTYDHAMFSTWDISFTHIERQSQSAATLLRLWAYFSNEDLWYELLKEGGSDRGDWLTEVTHDRITFDCTMRILCSHGLVDVDPAARECGSESRGYNVHGCVHSWMIHALNPEINAEMARIAIKCVARHVPTERKREYWLVERRLVQHADRGFEMVRKSVELEEDEEGWVFHNLGLLYADQGRLKEAEDMYQRALRGYEKAWGPDHTSTLNTVNNLGILYKAQGRLQEAEDMYQRVLQGKEKALGPDHTSTFDTVNNLGNLYQNQGRLNDAEDMYQRALRGKEKAWGPDHTSTLGTVNNLGILYKAQGRLQEAEDMYQRALRGFEKALGPDHTSTLNTVNNLGLLYKDQGRLKEAEAMYERALRGYEKALGDLQMATYPPALNTLENLGDLLDKSGRTGQALLYYSRAATGVVKVYGAQSQRYQRLASKLHTVA